LKGPSTAQLACEIINRLPEAEVAPLPTIMPVPECWYEPCPLNHIQQAYWIGRGDAFDLGNIATHGYLEVESDELDIERFNFAWQRLIGHHQMLRAVVLPDGRQQILERVP